MPLLLTSQPVRVRRRPLRNINPRARFKIGRYEPLFAIPYSNFRVDNSEVALQISLGPRERLGRTAHWL